MPSDTHRHDHDHAEDAQASGGSCCGSAATCGDIAPTIDRRALDSGKNQIAAKHDPAAIMSRNRVRTAVDGILQAHLTKDEATERLDLQFAKVTTKTNIDRARNRRKKRKKTKGL